ncbi:hypothetical protein QTH87_08590 [Variovorax sp. J22P168]|uniref:hypothetical protein n=1 Tax=Variovorax jilinensis TaxID=3053513 RepID=UPI0025761016|nr:hypothetical protein [Variovorax sp. J22P168]MDM0012488.1 hypothetical protein [Variovorax sp. J22P168]
MTAATLGNEPPFESTLTTPSPARDLACTGAVHRIMGRIDHYLRCETREDAHDGVRLIARRQLEAVLVQELVSARLMGVRI